MQTIFEVYERWIDTPEVGGSIAYFTTRELAERFIEIVKKENDTKHTEFVIHQYPLYDSLAE
jgi:hypothetical protein